MDARARRARQIQADIQAVLLQHWDPLGIGADPTWPRDELDRYAGAVYRVLSVSRSKDDLILCLSRIEADFGLAPSRESLEPVADRLLALDVEL